MLEIIKQIFHIMKPKLVTLEKDNYELDNAEIRQQEFPDTFVIPPKNIRENILSFPLRPRWECIREP